MVVELYTFPFPPQKTSKFLHPEKTQPHFHTPLTPSHRTRCVLFLRLLCVCVCRPGGGGAARRPRRCQCRRPQWGNCAHEGRVLWPRQGERGHTAGRERGSSPHTHNMPLEGDETEGVGRKGVSCDPSRVGGAGAWARVYFLGRRLRGQWGGSLWESPLKEEMTTLHQRRSCSPFNALPSAVLNV